MAALLQRYRMHLLLALAAALVLLNMLHPAAPTVEPLVQFAERGPGSAASARITNTATSWDRPALEPARRDPFGSLAPAPAIPKATVVPPPPVAAPVVAVAPPHNLVFAGRISGSDGREQVYVTSGDTSLVLSVGQTLPTGYRVDAITERAIELSYPPLNTTARIDLPPPPRYETR
jgi:hypothetical protein